jgi:hypothetical protein
MSAVGASTSSPPIVDQAGAKGELIVVGPARDGGGDSNLRVHIAALTARGCKRWVQRDRKDPHSSHSMPLTNQRVP